MVLTFDDGPHPDYTPDILDTLAEYDVRAMFFVCGECVVDNKELLARMADEGHVVGNHTWTHPLLTSLDRDEIRDEMESTSDVIEDAYGERPQWFRAPYGAWNRAAFQLGADMGMEPMAWTVDTTDWMEPGTSAIVDRVEGRAAPGRGALPRRRGRPFADGPRDPGMAALPARLRIPPDRAAPARVTVPGSGFPNGSAVLPAAGPRRFRRPRPGGAKTTTFPS